MPDRRASRSELASDTAAKIYDVKEVADQSVKQLRENKDLTAEQRQIATDQIKQETEKTVKTSLGEKGYNRYLSQGGRWIMNLSPAPRRQ